MSCLFIHDFRSYKKNGKMYTGNLSYDIWNSRYIKYFGDINVLNRCGRMKSDEDVSKYVLASGEHVNFLDEIDIFTPMSFWKNYLKYKKIIVDNIKKNQYVIIRLDSFLGLIAARYCKKHKKAYLIEVVGCVWDSFWNKSGLGKCIAAPLFFCMKYYVKHANYVVYVTKSFLQRRYPTDGRSVNISNVYLPKHDDIILNERLKHIESINENKYIFQLVTVASVSVKYKGQDSVIRSLGELKSKGELRFFYHLIGAGDQRYLRKIAEKYGVLDNICFHGNMNHDDVIRFLDNCDIYIQPSKQEGLPRALIEAMSRGLLCYGSRIAGIPELLDQEMMFSTKKKNYKEIGEKLDKIDLKIYKKQSIRNFKIAQEYENKILSNRRDAFFNEFKKRSTNN